MFVTRAPQAVAAQIQDTLVVLNEKFEFVELDALGAMVWDRIGAGIESSEIVTTLAAEFHIDLEQVRTDIERFLGQLRDVGLVDFA